MSVLKEEWAPDDEDGDDDDERRRERRKKHPDPMVRTNVPFGGVINDFKRRGPWYWSDIRDGLNVQCFSAAIFIYFACLSGAVAFGGLLGDKTRGLIGIPETLIVSCASGALFALLSGQPLIITGVTGPVLLFDEALFGFSEANGIAFLSWRVWIGIWTAVIALMVAAFQGSTLVRHFTKFTKDIFASLVALLFVFEALRKLVIVGRKSLTPSRVATYPRFIRQIFADHPLMSLDTYCNATLEKTILAITNRTLYDEVQYILTLNIDGTCPLTAVEHLRRTWPIR